MTVKAHIVAIHELKAGESVGYGGTYKVPKSVGRGSKERVAILAAGYADGIHRMLSNCGTVWIRNQQCRVLGTVAMDLCAVSSPPKACVGDWAELIGCNEDLWTQAKSAGTIPYELLTSVSGRVQRVYV
jgi:alanine racemase